MNKYKLLIAFISGIIASYAFAPTYYIFLLPISFPVLMALLFNAKSYKESFFIGWSFGFGYFLKGLYWISYALLVDDVFEWVVPFAVILIPATFALYTGITAIFLYKLKGKTTISFTLTFISLWILFEIIRSKLFTGFPWLALGYSIANWPTMIQTASLGGVFLLSFILLSVSSTPFLLLNSKIYKENCILPLIISSLFIIFFFSNYIYGYLRLDNAEIKFHDKNIKIIQPNIKQHLKWNKSTKYKNLLKIIEMTKQEDTTNLGYIVWPESATSTYPLNDHNIRNLIKTSIPPNSYLLAGGIRYGNNLHVWNSVFVIDHNGSIINTYDKMHLVPFGEYIPLRKFLPFDINKITHGLIDFTPGTKAKIIKIDNLPSFRPLICYETFFSGEILSNNTRPDLLINFTNDAWYRDSPGPYQHLDITIFRSVEYGMPIARAANTGISVIVDSYGRILKSLPLNKDGIINQKVPFALEKSTFYSIYGSYILLILLLISLGIGLMREFLTSIKKKYGKNFPIRY